MCSHAATLYLFLSPGQYRSPDAIMVNPPIYLRAQRQLYVYYSYIFDSAGWYVWRAPNDQLHHHLEA